MTITATNTLRRDKKELLGTTASGSTTAYNIPNKSKLSVQLILSNTDEVGTLKVEISNDKSNWFTVWYKDASETLQSTGYAVSSGTDVNFFFDPLETFASFLRVTYTRTSGGDAARNIEVWINDVSR